MGKEGRKDNGRGEERRERGKEGEKIREEERGRTGEMEEGREGWREREVREIRKVDGKFEESFGAVTNCVAINRKDLDSHMISFFFYTAGI